MGPPFERTRESIGRWGIIMDNHRQVNESKRSVVAIRHGKESETQPYACNGLEVNVKEISCRVWQLWVLVWIRLAAGCQTPVTPKRDLGAGRLFILK